MYIEREAVLEILKKYSVGTWKGIPCYPYEIKSVAKDVNAIPAADVAPVVRGRWEVYLGGKELMCSACKATFWDEDGVGGSNYRPNCGCKMDGERKEPNV